MKLLVFVLLLLNLHAVIGFGLRDVKDTVKKCAVPKRFEGKFKVKLKIGGTVIGTGTGTLHVDDTLARGVIFEKVHAHGQMTEVNVFLHSNSQMAYYAMPSLRTCQKKPLKMPLLPGTVPKGATLQVRKGKLDGVPVQIWDVRSEQDTTGLESAHIYLTDDNCMPIKMEFMISVNGQRIWVTENWYDMKEGTEDTSLFELPNYCVKKISYGITHSNQLGHSHAWHVHHAMAKQEAHKYLFH